MSRLDILSITDKDKDIRYSVFTPRAKLDSQLVFNGERGTFCDLFAKRCRDGFRPIGKPQPSG